MREALMSKGNSKNVSEKALLLTGKNFHYFQETQVLRQHKSGFNNTNMTLILKKK